MKHSAIHRTLVAGTASVLLLSGCSDESTSDQGSDLTYGKSPLSEYMSSVWDSGSDPAAGIEAQEDVAQCMAGQGFEYVVQGAGSDGASVLDVDVAEMNTEAWIAKNGFGAAAVYASSAQATSDPNAEYVESLSEASRAEYYAALYGEYGEGMTEEELESYVPSPEEQGCYGAVQTEDSPSDIFSDPEYQQLSEKMMDVAIDAREDPAVVAATKEWSDCVADAGYPDVASQEELLDDAYSRYDEVYGWEGGMPPAEEVTPDAGALAEARAWEIDAALADFRCREEVDYDTIFLTAFHAGEEQFITDHKSELDAFIAEYGS